MDAKKLAMGAVTGTLSQIVLMFLLFGLLLEAFYEANAAGAADLMRETPLFWPMVLGNLALAILVTLAIGHTGAFSFKDGFLVGGVVGFLLWFGIHFSMYSNIELMSLTLIAIDPLLEFVRTGITGGLIGLVLARLSKTEPAPAL